MTTLLLEPHLDDAVLFATYTLLREKPMVVTVCSDARVQETYGITGDMRRNEWARSMSVVGNVWSERLHMSDVSLDADDLTVRLFRLRSDYRITKVWAPLYEEGGHEQHNQVALAAVKAFNGVEVCRYATYRRGSTRTRTETEVTPEPHWPALKFKAMACYESQINLPNCQPWFAADDMLREWIA